MSLEKHIRKLIRSELSHSSKSHTHTSEKLKPPPQKRKPHHKPTPSVLKGVAVAAEKAALKRVLGPKHKK
jgi:hypothetical protein